MATIAAGERRPLGRPVAGEIGRRHAAALVAHGLDDVFGNPAFIKGTRPVLRDRFQRIGEIALHQPLAAFECAAVRAQEDRPRRGIAPQPGAARQRIGEIVLDPDAVARQRDCRREQVGEAEMAGAVMRMRVSQTCDRAGHAHGQSAVARFIRVGETLRVEEHVRRGRRRRGFAIIERNRLLIFSEADQHEAAAAEIAGARQRHGERKSDRDRRIDGVAAAPQDVDADPRRFAFLRNDHAVLRQNRQNTRLAFDDRRRRVVGARCGRDCERDGKRQREARKSKTHHSPMRWRQSISPM